MGEHDSPMRRLRIEGDGSAGESGTGGGIHFAPRAWDLGWTQENLVPLFELSAVSSHHGGTRH